MSIVLSKVAKKNGSRNTKYLSLDANQCLTVYCNSVVKKDELFL